MKADYILLQDRLKGEYKDAFQKVQMYSTSNLIGEDTESELMMELLDHMLMAQEEGKPVSTIVGDDIEGFCEIFFSEYKLGNRFVDFLKTLYRMAWIMLVFAILDLVIGDGVLSSSDIGAIGAIVLGGLSGSLSILIIYLLIRPLVKRRKVNATALNAIYIVLLLASVIITCVLANRYSINVPAWVAVTIPAVYIVVYFIVNAITNYKKYRSIRKPKEAKLSFFGGVKESVSRELPEEWLEQWTKKNERRRRKGQTPLSEEEFMEKLDKQYDYRRSQIMNVLVFSICTFGLLLMELVFAAPPMKEFAWHAAILILCESGVCAFYSSSGKNACATYAKMRARMKAENLTFAEYVAKDGTAE